MSPDAIGAIRIFFLGMLPAAETSAAIPFGILTTNLSAPAILLLAFAGSTAALLIVTPLLYRFGETVARRARLFTLLLERTRIRHASRFGGAYDLALVGLIAMPQPFSGVWTGMLVAVIFGVPSRHAILLIAAGNLVSSLIVLFGVLGIINIF